MFYPIDDRCHPESHFFFKVVRYVTQIRAEDPTLKINVQQKLDLRLKKRKYQEVSLVMK